MINLTKQAKFIRLMNVQAAGTNDTINSTVVDVSGIDSIVFVSSVGTVDNTGTVDIHVETSSDNSTFNDLLGSKISFATADDNKIAVTEIVHPQEQYLRVAATRATANAVLDGVVAILNGAPSVPVTADTTTVKSTEIHQSPAEGTA